jgi:putative ABC transport system substrate-binding protein
MRRRDFIKVMAGSAAAWPLAARAQQSDRRRLGLLTNLSDAAEIKGRIGPFLEELQRLGWTDGHNIHSTNAVALPTSMPYANKQRN